MPSRTMPAIVMGIRPVNDTAYRKVVVQAHTALFSCSHALRYHLRESGICVGSVDLQVQFLGQRIRDRSDVHRFEPLPVREDIGYRRPPVFLTGPSVVQEIEVLPLIADDHGGSE